MKSVPVTESQSINQALENSLNSETATSMAADSLEIIFDQVLDEGLLKEIPIVGWIFGGAKIVMSIRDRMYIKKLLTFISSTEGTSETEREKFFSELSKHQEEKDRLFEKILLTIDRLDDIKKAKYIGKAFMHLIKGDITMLEYYRICAAIETILYDDLDLFLAMNGKRPYSDDELEVLHAARVKIPAQQLEASLIKAGIMDEKIELINQNRVSGSDKPQLKIERKINRVGNLLIEIEYNKGFYFPKNLEKEDKS